MIIPGRIRWLWLTLIVVLLDRATKAWIESRPLTYFPHVVIPNWFNIILSRNPGIAFSFFSNGSSIWTRVILIVGSVLIIGLISWLLVAGRGPSPVHAAGLAPVLGGAAGGISPRNSPRAAQGFLVMVGAV